MRSPDAVEPMGSPLEFSQGEHQSFRMVDEHRAATRRRTLKEGQVVLTDSTLMNCTIRDLSETGARLEFAGLVTLPKEFRLLIVSSNTIVPVALAWQRGPLVGVYFTGPQQPAPARRG
jgi:hypothetical protein